MAPKLPPKPVRELARVLFSYKAQNEDELTIKEGDIITIISKENEDVGWWKGELNGRIALFPDNFVEIIKSAATPTTPTTTSVISNASEQNTENQSMNNETNISSKLASNNNTQEYTSTNNDKSIVNDSDSEKQSTLRPRVAIPSNNVSNNGNDNVNLRSQSYMTTERPRISTELRRPPSMLLMKKTNKESPLHDDGFTEFFSTDGTESAPNNRDSISEIVAATQPKNAKESTVSSVSNFVKNQEQQQNSTNSKKVPWISELKRKQESKRNVEHDNVGNSTTTNATSSSTGTTNNCNDSSNTDHVPSPGIASATSGNIFGSLNKNFMNNNTNKNGNSTTTVPENSNLVSPATPPTGNITESRRKIIQKTTESSSANETTSDLTTCSSNDNKIIQELRDKLNKMDLKLQNFTIQQENAMQNMQNTIDQLLEREKKLKSQFSKLVNDWSDELN